MLGTLVGSHLALPAAQAQDNPAKFDPVRFRYAKERAEKFVDIKAVPKIPDTALGVYEYEFFAGEKMAMKLDLSAGADPATGEFLYTSAISLSQPTGPKSSFMLNDVVKCRPTLALIVANHDYKLTSPAYHEQTKAVLKLERGQIVIDQETIRGAGAPPSKSTKNLPMQPTQIHKSLVYLFASLCRGAPLKEPLGLTILESNGLTSNAMFTRTGQTKAIDAMGVSTLCVEIEVAVEETDRVVTDRFYVDELGRVLSQESDLNKSKGGLLLMKFTPTGAPTRLPAAETASKHLQAEDQLDNADKQLAKKEILRAARMMAKALELEPTNARALAFKKALQERVDADFAALKPTAPEYAEQLKELSRVQERLDPKHPNFAKMEAALKKR